MKPVRLPAAATLALPRWALFALGLLYILPGLIGRDPWKDDAGSLLAVVCLRKCKSMRYAAAYLQE